MMAECARKRRISGRLNFRIKGQGPGMVYAAFFTSGWPQEVITLYIDLQFGIEHEEPYSLG